MSGARLERPIGLGVIGLGRAFMLMLPTFTAHPQVRLVAAMDPREVARAHFASTFSARAYAELDALLADPAVEAVYIASPHQAHRDQVIRAVQAGKHVLVEKPMAITLEDCAAMSEAARKAGVHLVVGHSHGFDAPVQHARALIRSGAYGRLHMITALNYTDFLYRPRRPEELDVAQGGGVVFSQGAHQVDVVRLLGGGRVKSLRASASIWDPARKSHSAYTALLTFEDGCAASLTYSGHAHFDSDEFCGWIGETGLRRDPARYGAARALLRGAQESDEIALKNARTFGSGAATPAAHPDAHNHFGLIIASCEGADLRPDAEGVRIYADEARCFEALPPPVIPRAEVIDALHAAVRLGRPPVHDGEWGMATLEVCLAILQSARECREIDLRHQVPPGDMR